MSLFYLVLFSTSKSRRKSKTCVSLSPDLTQSRNELSHRSDSEVETGGSVQISPLKQSDLPKIHCRYSKTGRSPKPVTLISESLPNPRILTLPLQTEVFQTPHR